MSIFTSIRHKHLQDIHKTKELTYGKEVLVFNPKEIFIPLVDPVNAKPIKLEKSIGDDVKEGTIIGYREDNMIPVFATISGKIVREELVYHVNIGRNVKHFVIQNDEKYEHEDFLPILDENASKDEMLKRMVDAAILGHGGAGFPMFIKYRKTDGIDTILVNAVECEPYLSDDHHSLLVNKKYVVKGMELLLKLSGAKEAILCYKVGNEDVDKVYKDLSDLNPNLKVYKVKNVYPSGWERHLVKEVLKREYNRLPSEAHAIVNNLESVVRFAKAMMEGRVITRKTVTISGEGINNPSNVELPIYTKASDVIAFLGGYKFDEVSLSYGGPMCSRGVNSDQGVFLSYTSGLTILPRLKVNTLPCLRCGACTSHCPSYLQPVEIKIAYQAKNNDRMMALKPWLCIGCGLCSYICPSKIDVNDFVKKAKLITSMKLKQMEANKGGKK